MTAAAAPPHAYVGRCWKTEITPRDIYTDTALGIPLSIWKVNLLLTRAHRLLSRTKSHPPNHRSLIEDSVNYVNQVLVGSRIIMCFHSAESIFECGTCLIQ